MVSACRSDIKCMKGIAEQNHLVFLDFCKSLLAMRDQSDELATLLESSAVLKLIADFDRNQEALRQVAERTDSPRRCAQSPTISSFKSHERIFKASFTSALQSPRPAVNKMK